MVGRPPVGRWSGKCCANPNCLETPSLAFSTTAQRDECSWHHAEQKLSGTSRSRIVQNLGRILFEAMFATMLPKKLSVSSLLDGNSICSNWLFQRVVSIFVRCTGDVDNGLCWNFPRLQGWQRLARPNFFHFKNRFVSAHRNKFEQIWTELVQLKTWEVMCCYCIFEGSRCSCLSTDKIRSRFGGCSQ